MNKAEVMDKLGAMTDITSRTVTHGTNGRVVVEPDVIIVQPGDRQHALTIPRAGEGEKSLKRFVGVPADLQKRVQPDTYSRVMNDILGSMGQYQVMMRHNEPVAFQGPSQAACANPERVLNTVSKAIRGDVDFHRVNFENYRVTLEVTGTNETPVVPGDLVRGGALINFSPIGIVRPSVQAFVVRLECTNGMTSNHALAEFMWSGGGDDNSELWNWIRDRVRNAYGSIRSVAASYRKLTREAVSPRDRAAVLEGLIKQAGLSKEEAAAVHAQAIERPPENSYDMVNLITWASSHVVGDYTRIRRAQASVAQFVDQTEHARVCPLCQKNR